LGLAAFTIIGDSRIDVRYLTLDPEGRVNVNKLNNNGGGSYMKKLTWVLAVSMVLVFALAAVAYADTFSTYATWTSGLSNTGSSPTPHKDYRLTTVKCAVCHAVHKAELGGQILLQNTVQNACLYCHVQTNIGGTQIYGGNTNWYITATNMAHNNGCSECHAVHGANTISPALFPDLTARILRTLPSNQPAQANAPWDYTNGVRDGVVSAFCAHCHPYYVGNYEQTHLGTLGVGTYKGHVMTTTIAAYNNPNATQATGSPVAYATDFYCRSCHDAGRVVQGVGGPWTDNFPHYTKGDRFENAATSVAGLATGPAGIAATTSPVQDGVCLKCHVNGTGSAGIGITF
jgi:predicted CXXCH cytochrome family protein